MNVIFFLTKAPLLIVFHFIFATSTITNNSQDKATFLGCEFGSTRNFTIKYFETNLGGEIFKTQTNNDTINMFVESFIGEFKASYITLYFHNNVFIGGNINFNVKDNIDYHDKGKLLASIKKYLLTKYPSLTLIKPDEFSNFSNFEKREKYLSKKWLVEFSEPYLFDSIEILMYDTDLMKKYLISKSPKADF